MKKFEISLIIAFIITALFFSELGFVAKDCDDISQKVLRLHIKLIHHLMLTKS